MRLWEKNYLLTMALLLIILYGSTFFIQNHSYQTNFEQARENALWTQQNILSSVQSLFNADQTHTKLKLYCQALEKKDIQAAILIDGKIFYNALPAEIPDNKTGEISFIRHNRHRYFYLSDSFLSQNQTISVFYMMTMDDFYKTNLKQICLFLAINAVISFLLAGILYSAMRNMYSPVNNIAHELRTPLTAIQGYAQYILFGNISQEDIYYASEQINREAGYINEIIDRLLVMEHIQNGEIHLEKLDLSELFETIKKHYPAVVLQNDMTSFLGDHSLILCLFLNLLSNISRSDGEITITASQGRITISNRNDFIEEKILTILNENRPVPKEQIKGKGLGVPLCHEIIKLHHGTLRYESSMQDGVRVVLTLPDLH